MTTVALATTWDERCGIAEYAKNLFLYCPAYFKVIYTLNEGAISDLARGTDILCFNYEPGLFPWLNEQTIRHFDCHKKVLILHTSHEGYNRNIFTGSFDQVVVHERTLDSFAHIPMGIPEYRPRHLPEDHFGRIGTFGFPFPWKNFPAVVSAVKSLGLMSTVIAPESSHWDANHVKQYLMDLDPNVQVITQYLEQTRVIDILGRCEVNVFAYSGANAGISGAVRQGLASARPLVLTRCRMFRDLFDYEDEITFVDDERPDTIAKGIETALANPQKVPNRVLTDMSWEVCGQKYLELFKSL